MQSGQWYLLGREVARIPLPDAARMAGWSDPTAATGCDTVAAGAAIPEAVATPIGIPYVPTTVAAPDVGVPCMPYTVGLPYITPYPMLAPTAACPAVAACVAARYYNSLAPRTTSSQETVPPPTSISLIAFLMLTQAYSSPTSCFSKASITDSESRRNLARDSSTRNTKASQLSKGARVSW